MKLSTVSLLCAIAYACGALARAQECETEAFNNLPELCRIESSVPAGSRNITELYRVSELSCDTCGKPLYDYLRCTDSQPNVANVNATCARNKNGDFCYRTVFPLNGTLDISSVFRACSGTIFSLTNASCSEDCMNTLRSWTNVAGCCITSVYSLVNDTNIQLLLDQSNRNRQNFTTFICSGSGRDGHNGGVWKECEYSQERCSLGQHKYFSESFEGEIALYRGGIKDYKPVLAKRYVVCVVLNGESGFQDDVVMRKLKFGELLLARHSCRSFCLVYIIISHQCGYWLVHACTQFSLMIPPIIMAFHCRSCASGQVPKSILHEKFQF